MSKESKTEVAPSDYFNVEFRILFSVLAAVALGSFVLTDDRINWFLDAVWVAVGLPLVFFSRRWFPLTPLLYRLLVFHALVLIAGGALDVREDASWSLGTGTLGI